MEGEVRVAVEACLDGWSRPVQQKNGARNSSSVHSHVMAIDLSQWGMSVWEQGYGSAIEWDDGPDGGAIKNVRVIEGEGGSAAAAAARVVLAGSKRAGWLTLLRLGDEWKVISAVFSRLDGRPVTPAEVFSLSTWCWDGYRGANQACDGFAMSKVFHEYSRLTYVNHAGDKPSVVIHNQQEFIKMVRERYQTGVHKQYAPMRKQYIERMAAKDTIISVEFATSDLAMVTMQIGQPPFLWTDLLTCGRMQGQWWILAKSSCHDHFIPEV